MRTLIIVSLIAYLCGSIPFGYILVRIVKGKDIRESGSGNIGATNVARTAPVLGIATLFLDGLKGFLPVKILLSPAIGVSYDAMTTSYSTLIACAAVFAVLGHVFSIWLKFRGGKGVATGVGVFFALAPASMAITIALFAAVLALTRYVSLASIVGAICFPAIAWFLDFSRQPALRDYPVTLAAIFISILIIAKHHANIRRLLAGTENRFGKAKVLELAKED
jgi:acyl phosphate:glycerol-3-phosphate acyltransferase